MSFVTLRLFCAVAQSGSITKGAATCHLALSAASRRLSDFDAAAGTPLFERSAQGVWLTPAGRIALQHATRLLHSFEHLSAELADYSEGYRGHVRLWANMSSLTEFLPSALSTFLGAHPEIRVDIEEHLSGDIVRGLVSELADVGVFAAGTSTEGLSLTPFRTDELVLVCALTHPLAALKQLSFASCLDYDFVGLNQGSSLLELIMGAAAEADRPLRLRVQVRSFDAMSQMIAANLGVGVMPIGACQVLLKPRGLRAIRLSDAWAHRQLLLGYAAEKPLSPAARALVDSLLTPVD